MPSCEYGSVAGEHAANHVDGLVGQLVAFVEVDAERGELGLR